MWLAPELTLDVGAAASLDFAGKLSANAADDKVIIKAAPDQATCFISNFMA
jgi:hypothetical protein